MCIGMSDIKYNYARFFIIAAATVQKLKKARFLNDCFYGMDHITSGILPCMCTYINMYMYRYIYMTQVEGCKMTHSYVA